MFNFRHSQKFRPPTRVPGLGNPRPPRSSSPLWGLLPFRWLLRTPPCSGPHAPTSLAYHSPGASHYPTKPTSFAPQNCRQGHLSVQWLQKPLALPPSGGSPQENPTSIKSPLPKRFPLFSTILQYFPNNWNIYHFMLE